MARIEASGKQLAGILGKFRADYIEVHLEESEASHIAYRGKKLESIERTTAIGGNVRALVKGGWGFVSFNTLDELPGRIELAVKQAQLVGGDATQLAEVAPVVDSIRQDASHNPLTIPLVEKKQLLDEYNGIIWRTPKIQTPMINYGDNHRKTIFLNSAGSYIEQE
ncbi:MAG: TldD/PmbA family protein, partial [Chloroflexi bacterium]|nr:TldD/PmbA family protein [Chloroflexota bacterium]